MALILVLLCCALGAGAEPADPSLLEAGLVLESSSGLEYRSRLRRGGLELHLSARAEGLGLGLGVEGEGGRLAAGSLLPAGGLPLLLDPLGWAPVGSGSLGRPDPALSSSLRGILLEEGGLGAFVLSRGLLPAPTEEEPAFDPVTEDPPPPLVLGGMAANLSLARARLGLLLGLARSPGGPEPSSWYDAALPGAWPRLLASLSASWAGGRELSLFFSEALDRGRGFGLRLQGGGRLGSLDYRLALVARSPSFQGAEDTLVLARTRGQFGLEFGEGGRLEFRAELEARETEDSASPEGPLGAPELRRGLGLRLSSSPPRPGSLDLRCEFGARVEAERRLLVASLGLGKGPLAAEFRCRAEWSREGELPGSWLPGAGALSLLRLGGSLDFRPDRGSRATCLLIWESEVLEKGWRPSLELRPALDTALGREYGLGLWALLEARGQAAPASPWGRLGHPEPPKLGLRITYRFPP